MGYSGSPSGSARRLEPKPCGPARRLHEHILLLGCLVRGVYPSLSTGYERNYSRYYTAAARLTLESTLTGYVFCARSMSLCYTVDVSVGERSPDRTVRGFEPGGAPRPRARAQARLDRRSTGIRPHLVGSGAARARSNPALRHGLSPSVRNSKSPAAKHRVGVILRFRAFQALA